MAVRYRRKGSEVAMSLISTLCYDWADSLERSLGNGKIS